MEKLNKSFLIFLLLGLNLTLFAQTYKPFKECQCLSKQERIKTYEIFEVEKRPQFPGGDKELLKYLAENFHYSGMDSIDDPEPRIYATFIIDTLGKARNLCVIKPIYPNWLTNLEKEVLMVLEKMPDWIPAERNGKKVSVKFIIPARIRLQSKF